MDCDPSYVRSKPTIVYLRPRCEVKTRIKTIREEFKDDCGNKVITEKPCTEEITVCDDTFYCISERPDNQNPTIRCGFSVFSLWVVAIIITIMIIIAGTFFHNLYRVSNNNKCVGYWTPTSESIWATSVASKTYLFAFYIHGTNLVVYNRILHCQLCICD